MDLTAPEVKTKTARPDMVTSHVPIMRIRTADFNKPDQFRCRIGFAAGPVLGRGAVCGWRRWRTTLRNHHNLKSGNIPRLD
jgi:hypothetical protein